MSTFNIEVNVMNTFRVVMKFFIDAACSLYFSRAIVDI
jgi:hypothetical protein